MANKLWQLLVLLKPADLRVFIYTNKYYWDSTVDWRLHPFTDYTLWFTKWLTTDLNERYMMDPSGSMPQGWDKWALWQYTDSGSVPGVKGPVDMDRGFCRND
jgi:GH25 family lysozyme M1 (1,4-beta-N-acetylmuramidase)